MIRPHDFNSRWWGGAVGIVDDPAFLALPPAERRRRLEPYEWAELRTADRRLAAALGADGWLHADTQVTFELALDALPPLEPQSLGLEVVTAAEGRWPLRPLAAFRHERFALLPGVGEHRLAERYELWASELRASAPQWCVQVQRDGSPQGWYFSQEHGERLNLTLGAAAPGAAVRGRFVYHAAFDRYRRDGARAAYASFSASNLAPMNIYSRLGARFVRAEGCWLWVRPASRARAA